MTGKLDILSFSFFHVPFLCLFPVQLFPYLFRSFSFLLPRPILSNFAFFLVLVLSFYLFLPLFLFLFPLPCPFLLFVYPVGFASQKLGTFAVSKSMHAYTL